jgi:uncharacterized membrane protein YvbJ
MSLCPHCGATNPEGAIDCLNCRVALNSAAELTTNSQMTSSKNDEMSLRLEKAIRRTEQLTYAAAGLAIAILGVLIVLSIM